jgi:phosphoglucomutase
VSIQQSLNLYQSWLDDELIDEQTKAELRALSGNDKEIEDRFYRELEFGTGGLRGVIGAGTNRMNIYTIARATQGLAQFILQQGAANPSVVIAYDSRNQSPEFALEAALVLAGNGIRAYVFEQLRPTPQLSFAVRHLQATAGIVITASHNPPEYNGYKAYDETGCQFLPEQAERIIAEVAAVHSFTAIKRLARARAEAEQLLVWLGAEVDEAFIATVSAVSIHPEIVAAQAEHMHIVFTPLHGTGNMPVREVLKRIGFRHVHVVAEQELPDALFSTVKSPNPEEREAFTLSLQLATQVGADLIIGTDPDCDRMGAVVKNSQGDFEVLTGNQIGALIAEYLFSQYAARGVLPANGVLVKSIVTSEMGTAIAASYGIPTINTLTGFKYIGGKMNHYAATDEQTYLFGYEESYGYLAGTHARDKDAVVASMLICEAAAFYKAQGKTLYDVLQELYGKHGFFRESLHSRTMKGKDGVAQIQRIMQHWREQSPQQINGIKVQELQDYLPGFAGLPSENVLKYILADGSWFCLRPSGTEPKIKIYFAVCGASLLLADKQLQSLMQAVLQVIDQIG